MRALRRLPWPALIAASVALLPFLPGLLGGDTLYFRDLSLDYMPIRRYVAEGLSRGEIRFWNPLIHEGEMVRPPAVSYPLDLLQGLRPDEVGITRTLVMHVPLAALSFAALARSLGLGPAATAGGALVYSLGGFALSTISLYVYVQVLAWAPLVVLGLRRAAQRWRGVIGAALALAVALSTAGIEVVAQAVLLGLVLALGREGAGRSLPRLAAALALAVALVAPTVVMIGAAMGGSARDAGFPTDVVLAQSIHPLTLVQTLVGSWHGDLGNLTGRWWGQNFFPRGFPYFVSFYLGPLVLALAAGGLASGRPLARRLGLLAALALVVCLGRWAGFSALVDHLPPLHRIRYPMKAYFTVHMAVALLAAFGLEAVARGSARRVTAWALGLGGFLVAAPALTRLAPGAVAWFAGGFLPPGWTSAARAEVVGTVLGDAATGGLVAAVGGLLALGAARSRLPGPLAAVALAALVAADLLRTGAALNPMAPPALYVPSPPVAAQVERMRLEGGRLFTCELVGQEVYARARAARPGRHELWTFASLVDGLTPPMSMRTGLKGGLGVDISMMVPLELVTSPEEATCRNLPPLLSRLRSAGVAHVVSAQPLDSPELQLRGVAATERAAPLAFAFYALRDPLPLWTLARAVRPVSTREAAEAVAAEPGFQASGGTAVEGVPAAVEGAAGRVTVEHDEPRHVAIVAEADRPTVIVVRDAFAAGWTATVDGRPAPLLRADGRHRAVPVPAGRSRVELRYAPPRLGLGLAASALALACLGALAVLTRRSPAAPAA